MNTRSNTLSAAALAAVLGLAGLPAVAQAHDDGYRDNGHRYGVYGRHHDQGRHARWSVNRGAFGWGYRSGFRRGRHHGYRHRHHRPVIAPRYGYGYRTSVRIWVGETGFGYRGRRCD